MPDRVAFAAAIALAALAVAWLSCLALHARDPGHELTPRGWARPFC